jgi:hypothetical protein
MGLGVGAGGVLGTIAEASIFHGHSPTTGWLLDFRISGGNNVGTGSISFTDTTITPRSLNNNANSVFLSGGPRIRWFTRSAGDFSPYVDVFVHGSYGHSHSWVNASGRSDLSSYGGIAATGAALGAEYFTRWHFSIAAHSTLVALNWQHTNEKGESGFANSDRTSSNFSANATLSPSLFLRVYF